jgi:hypothetical protein
MWQEADYGSSTGMWDVTDGSIRHDEYEGTLIGARGDENGPPRRGRPRSPSPLRDSVSRMLNSLSISNNGIGESLPPTSTLARDDTSWADVRIIDPYNDDESEEMMRLFVDGVPGQMSCVEYRSKEPMDYHGYLLDEERIIGLTVRSFFFLHILRDKTDSEIRAQYDDRTGTITSFDVFTL